MSLVRLLIKCNAKLESRDISGRTPLHAAIKHARTDVASHLLEAGASVNATDGCDNLPLHYAAKYDMTGTLESDVRQK